MPKKAFATVLFLLNGHFERKILLCGKSLHPLLLCAGNIPGVTPYDRLPIVMNFQHQALGLFLRFVEHVGQDHHHKVHRRYVVIVHNDLVAVDVEVHLGITVAKSRGILLLFHSELYRKDKESDTILRIVPLYFFCANFSLTRVRLRES